MPRNQPTTSNPQQKGIDDREAGTHTSHEASCPNCGDPMKRNMFRTGSVQHPGRDMHVCGRCGTRQ